MERPPKTSGRRGLREGVCLHGGPRKTGVYVHGELERGCEDGRPALPLHVNDKLGVSVGESSKLILVQVHDEEFVRGRELHRLPGELFVEVGSVSFVFLLNRKHKS